MSRESITFLLLLLFALQSNAETWVSVKDKSAELKKSTNCKRLVGKDRQMTCDCCLIQNALVRNEGAEAAKVRCQEKYLCQFDNSVPATSLLETAKSNMRSMSIINVHKLAHPPVLPEDGVLQGEDVINILQALNQEGHLRLPSGLFRPSEGNNPPLLVKPLKDSAKGFYTGQLFAVRYDNFYIDSSAGQPGQALKPLYIVKETKKGVGEIKHLYKMYASKLRAEKSSTEARIMGVAQENSPTIAKIAFDDLHFTIKTDGKTRYFSLLQTAPGRSFHSLLKQFGEIAHTTDIDSPEFQSEYRKMKQAFFRVGYSISELHQKYARDDGKRHVHKKTFTHGDLHSENIFYDEATGQVTLIDNETFALSLNHPSSGVNDVVELYMMHTIHTIAHRVSTQLTTNTEFHISDDIWHELWRSLFRGYLSAYGELSQEEYVEIHNDFKSKFYDGFSQLRIFKSLRNFKDQRKLKRFGPSMRRSQIKHHQLKMTFDRLLETEMQKYEKSKIPETIMQEAPKI